MLMVSTKLWHNNTFTNFFLKDVSLRFYNLVNLVSLSYKETSLHNFYFFSFSFWLKTFSLKDINAFIRFPILAFLCPLRKITFTIFTTPKIKQKREMEKHSLEYSSFFNVNYERFSLVLLLSNLERQKRVWRTSTGRKGEGGRGSGGGCHNYCPHP